ncbi:hypothetical protein llap_4327 [Limosa lapponica baueri]|uniref:Uncharacterized protein n=1 Tax=Limosa lapponica baueri TaxID=1758121 RepID=A0A2I0UH55_LIMLA|nr:hypothetical protein llap_4327 [Limosa lapponica baueri]
MLGWMFKERVPATRHATTWSKWIALITQELEWETISPPGIVEVIMDWPEGKDFRISPEEEVTLAEKALPYNKVTENEKKYALFTDGSLSLWESIRSGRLLCGVLHDKLQKLLIDKICRCESHAAGSRHC